MGHLVVMIFASPRYRGRMYSDIASTGNSPHCLAPLRTRGIRNDGLFHRIRAAPMPGCCPVSLAMALVCTQFLPHRPKSLIDGFIR
jgi:hypothetical protein